ncbi:TPA: hypothetical protein N2G38_004243 [Salmonella enterica]|nr:DUF550 domain-containing protein [Salmonella enterica subsp. enterica]HCL5311881.1 hypothetical protein [Salmonella enterica]
MSTITKERLARIYEENESLALANEQLRTELKAAKDRIAELEARYSSPRTSEREHAEWSDKTFGDVGPIVPDKRVWQQVLGRDDFKFTEGWNACRAAILQSFGSEDT